MSSVFFIRATEYAVPHLFLPACLLTLTDHGHLRANKRVFVPLPCKLRAIIVMPALLRILRDCAVDSVGAILVSARAGEIDCLVSDVMGWLL